MTGYSTPDGPAALHPDNCHCPACVDVAINAEDSESITHCPWIDARRESAMTEAQRLADEMVEARNGWIDGLSPDERALIDAMCDDQTPDHDDWLAGAWM